MLNTVSAIVVTYNRLQLLKTCLHYLNNQDYHLDNIFIINNHSTDGTTEYLNNINNPNIKAINMKKNVGGAGGFSNGLNIALTHSKSNYFWLMDDDSMPSSTALESLIKGSKKLNNHFGFLSSNVRLWKNNYPTNVPIASNDWSVLVSKSLIKIREATFVSFFVSRSVVEKMGLPIAEEFIWCDDTEYTHRISNKYPCYFVPDSIVFHNSNKVSNDENIFTDSANRIRFYRYGYRNRLYVDKRYYPFRRFLKDFIKILITIGKIPIKSHSHILLRMYYALVGLLSGVFFNPKIQFPEK